MEITNTGLEQSAALRKRVEADERRPSRKEAAAGTASGDKVSISARAQGLQASGSGRISDPATAMETARLVGEQIRGNGAGALAAHGNADSEMLRALAA